MKYPIKCFGFSINPKYKQQAEAKAKKVVDSLIKGRGNKK